MHEVPLPVIEQSVQPTTPITTPVSKQARTIGYILSALPVLALVLSAAMKFAKPPAVIAGFAKMGFSESTCYTLGMLEVICTVVYLIPRTAILGAILLTGYLGGAVCAGYRVGDPNSYTPALLGVLVWGGLYMREPRLRALIPLRR